MGMMKLFWDFCQKNVNVKRAPFFRMIISKRIDTLSMHIKFKGCLACYLHCFSLMLLPTNLSLWYSLHPKFWMQQSKQNAMYSRKNIKNHFKLWVIGKPPSLRPDPDKELTDEQLHFYAKVGLKYIIPGN